MAALSIFPSHVWQWGAIRLNVDTLIFTWISLAILAALCGAARWAIGRRPNGLFAYVVKQFIQVFVDATEPAWGSVSERIVSFFATISLFILICNALVLIPLCEEPTKDLNSTLAFSLVTLVFVQFHAAQAHGLFHFIQEYFKMPIAVRGVYPRWTVGAALGIAVRSLINICVGIAMFPMELMGKLSGTLSLAFRLFGNILAGSVIAMLWLQVRSGSLALQIVGLPLNLAIALFFGFFEAIVQAGVFTMVGLSYFARAVQHEE